MNKSIVIRKLPTKIVVIAGVCTLLFSVGILTNIRFFTMSGIFGLLFLGFLEVRKEYYFCAAFLVTMFTFLFGRIFVNWLINSPSLLSGAFIYDSGPKDDEIVTMMILLFLSNISFLLGVYLVPKNRTGVRNAGQLHSRRVNTHDYSQACLILFYVTVGFKFVVSAERFMFLLMGGSYTSYYTSFVRILPSFVYKIAEINQPAFFAVLACGISKKKVMPVMALYLLDGFIVLLGGQRNQFVRAVIVVICYMLIRRREDRRELWLTDWQIRILLMSVPLAIVAMQAWGTLRNGNQLNLENMFQTIVNFFQDQGATSVVVQKGIELQEAIPKGRFYSLSEVVNFLRNNVVTRLFYQYPIYAQQSTELAQLGNNYGATLTYTYIPHNYAVGIGMGTSYVAEVYHDFGIVGIPLVNIIFGVLLVRLEEGISIKNSMWKTMVLLLFADGILYAPRDSTLSFVTNGLNYTVLLSVLLILCLKQILEMRRIE